MPSIYVACLSAYNNGYLHGAWIDCSDTDEAEIWKRIEKMLKASPMNSEEWDYSAEEWRIDDWEGFGSIKVDDFTFEQIAEIGGYLAKNEENEQPFAYFVANINDFASSDSYDFLELFEEHYLGQYESISDFARQQLEDQGILSQLAQIPIFCECGADQFLDYDHLAHEYELSGDYHFFDKGYKEVYVFSK